MYLMTNAGWKNEKDGYEASYAFNEVHGPNIDPVACLPYKGMKNAYEDSK